MTTDTSLSLAHIQGPSEDGISKQVRELFELQGFLQGLLYMPAEAAFCICGEMWKNT